MKATYVLPSDVSREVAELVIDSWLDVDSDQVCVVVSEGAGRSRRTLWLEREGVVGHLNNLRRSDTR